MIFIKTYGIDPYSTLDISKIITNKLADVYECSEKNISFFAPEGFIIHKGNEQNSWNCYVEVLAPKKVSVLEEKAYDLLIHYFKRYSVHVTIVFNYYSHDNIHQYVCPDHPLFIDDTNAIEIEENEECCECHDDNCHCKHCDDSNHDNEEEAYLGDIFEEFNKHIKE
ncbi:MAG: hypothetical protein ACTTID_00175 [Bacillales bacterium]